MRVSPWLSLLTPILRLRRGGWLTNINAILARLRAIDSLVDRDLVERFRHDIGGLWATDAKLGVAVSGGADSLALLLLAREALPGMVEAATIDHGLRPESAKEAQHVVEICDRLEIPHVTLKVTVESGNLQANAREARYAALANWHDRRSLGALATAHHADDQAETLLMRLNRGSGLSGLAGIRAKSWIRPKETGGEYRLLRPLLGWRKSELIEVTRRANIGWISDPSNEDDNFDRVRVRKALAEQDWLDPVALSKSAQLLGEVWSDVEWEASAKLNRSVVRQDDGFVFFGSAGRVFEIENVLWICEQMGKKVSRSEADQLLNRMLEEKKTSLAGIQVRKIMHPTGPNSSQAGWKFESEPPRKAGSRPKSNN
ncbi:tRNA lysidine(34) synthetase TilS [Pontixanthobacter gangjinensis]|uniref:tRNA lysidine(34) synthetase TilS n=1 Tax=Pontixanthobacter gangjinensis TaxID=1028742 RepID=UPI002E270E33|nr:tRNA lysidine(34) synthetase TilS [Pontixanthobacter gangjinensis]